MLKRSFVCRDCGFTAMVSTSLLVTVTYGDLVSNDEKGNGLGLSRLGLVVRLGAACHFLP
jgi:hypothetical protein